MTNEFDKPQAIVSAIVLGFVGTAVTMGLPLVYLYPILTQLLKAKVPRPNTVRNNAVKQLDGCSRGNLKCKYTLFLV